MPGRRRADVALPAMRPRSDIQGLRAIAVLLVVLAHAGVPGVEGGTSASTSSSWSPDS